MDSVAHTFFNTISFHQQMQNLLTFISLSTPTHLQFFLMRNLALLALASSIPPYVLGTTNVETIPYTNRTRFILQTITIERNLGDRDFQALKQYWNGRTLAPTHSNSVRVTNILNNIIDALHKEVKKMRSASEKDSSQYNILYRVWLRITRRLPPSLLHLDGLIWEVLVVRHANFVAHSHAGGKIVASTAFIEAFASDVEITTFLAHEVAHIVARHHAEKDTRAHWIYTIHVVLNLFVTIDFEEKVLRFARRLPYNRRFEFEADYIGLLIMAAAGYDPRLAPKFYEKIAKLDGSDNVSMLSSFFGTHPPGRERANVLAQPEIMEEALILYNDVRARREVE